MNKKIISKLLITFILLFSLVNVNVNAQTNEESGLLDTYSSESSYKFSDGGDIYLPFVRYAKDRIIFDKKVDGLGTSFSGQSIEVNSEAKGLQVLFAGDSIRVDDKMEYSVMFARSNVTISSEIEKSVIIFAGEKINITSDAKLKGDVICFSPEIVVEGNIEGSLIGYAEKATINGEIKKDLRLETTDISLKDDIVKGNVFVETTNNALKIPESYKEAIVKVIEAQKEESGFNLSILLTAVITAAVYTLMFFIINKNKGNEVINSMINKVKNNTIYTILSGTLLLMTIPIIVLTLIIVSALGLYMVTVPLLIIYSAFLLVVGLLSTFIIGTMISEYMSKTKYLEGKGKNVKYVFAFCMFIVLYVFARLPYIGGYVTVALVLLAIGSVMCYMFKKETNEEIKEENKTEEKA